MSLGNLGEKPKKVRRAQIVGDTEMLRELQRRSVEKAKSNRKKREAAAESEAEMDELLAEIAAEKALFEEAARRRNTNEDIAPLQ